MQELGDPALAPDSRCVERRRAFNLKLAKLLLILMAEGGL
jgi:hypothetical protein